MKKKIVVAGLTSALLLTGGGLMYQTYAAEADSDNSVNNTTVEDVAVQGEDTASTEIEVTEVQEVIVEPDPNVEDPAVDLSDVPEGELLIPESIKAAAPATATNSLQSGDTPELKQIGLAAQNLDDGYHFRATYQSQNGSEIIVTQAPASDAVQTIESIKGFYSEPVDVSDINGHPVAYVNGKERKVVHLVFKDRIFTASTFNGSLDDAYNVIEQIQEQQ
ncbi:hypothetical protein [Paenibacillus jiagnxiensis]|uniref:hypothetical protein n=1 Tax=Paenibacillus jiagnxiensis TaxID=3228926 RepID=UPI0033A2A28A